jgi:MFS family permease
VLRLGVFTLSPGPVGFPIRRGGRARAFSFFGSVIGIAIMLGPVAGGLITQYLGWRWAFLVNLPIGVAMMALTLLAVEDSKDPHAEGRQHPAAHVHN